MGIRYFRVNVRSTKIRLIGRSIIGNGLRQVKCHWTPAAPGDRLWIMNGGIDEQVFCIVDIETASMRGSRPIRICEIGGIRTQGGRALERFQSLVNPEEPIAPEATRVHGIQDAMVSDAPRFSAIAPSLAEFFRGSILVAHNTAFDIPIICAEMRRAGLPPWKGASVDTVRLSRRAFSGLPSYGLDTLIDFFQLKIADRHRSMGDCEATLHIFWKCVQRLKELGKLRTLADLVELGRNRSLEKR